MIGEALRQERERQRLTIQDVEDGTSIRAAYIEAIESGEYDKMPGRVYAKGFVKNYAKFLQLDGDEFVKKFMAEVSPPEEVVEQVKEVDVENKSKRFSISGRRLEEVSSNFSSNHLVAAIMVVAILLGGFFYFGSSDSTEVAQVDNPKTQEVQTVPTTPDSAATPTPTENVVTTPAAAAPAPVDGVNLQATFTGDCWIMVTVDGNFVYEGIPTAGQVMDWKGNQSVNVRMGNAGAVDFVMNGQNFGKLGGIGDVVDKTFTR